MSDSEAKSAGKSNLFEASCNRMGFYPTIGIQASKKHEEKYARLNTNLRKTKPGFSQDKVNHKQILQQEDDKKAKNFWRRVMQAKQKHTQRSLQEGLSTNEVKIVNTKKVADSDERKKTWIKYQLSKLEGS